MSERISEDEPTLEIASGIRAPQLALGVFRAGAGAGTREAVLGALRAGFRHIDTAAIYRNEREVGEAIRESGLPRSAIFVTTKLWRDEDGYDETRRAFDQSLDALGLDHVDLYLVHWPAPSRLASWRALEEIHREGRARAIGVSNFMPRHLDELASRARVMPSVNQFEVHPFFPQREVVARCAALGIRVAAYSALTKGIRLEDSRLVSISRQVGHSPAQLLLRWGLQKGYIVIAKSSHPARIVENRASLRIELDASVMRALDALEDGGRTAWDPSDAP